MNSSIERRTFAVVSALLVALGFSPCAHAAQPDPKQIAGIPPVILAAGAGAAGLIGVLCWLTVRAVRARRSAVLALREGEALKARVFTDSADGILVLTLDGAIIATNRRAMERFQYLTPEQMRTLRWAEIWQSPHRGEAARALAGAKAGRTERFRAECCNVKGDARWWDVTVSHLPDADGRPERLLAVLRDITASRATEEKLCTLLEQSAVTEIALRESEERFLAFMNNSPGAAFIKDEDGRLVFINKFMEEKFQLRPEEIIGKTDFDWMPLDVARAVTEADRAVLASGESRQLLEMIPTADGQPKEWLSMKF